MSNVIKSTTGWMTCLKSGGMLPVLALVAIIAVGCSDTDDGGDDGDDLMPTQSQTAKATSQEYLCFDGVACVACPDDELANKDDLRCVDSTGSQAE